jgi:hypothetical protein
MASKNKIRHIEIIDALGNAMTPFEIKNADNAIVLNLNNLSQGIYLLRANYTNGKCLTAKFSYQK